MNAPVEVPAAGSRSGERTLLRVVLVLFVALSVAALAIDGLIGIVHAVTYNWMSVQIFVDLVLAVAVIDVWVHRDARARGRNPWPWVVASLLTGMIAPLIYLLVRGGDD